MRRSIARIAGQLCGAVTANFITTAQKRETARKELDRLYAILDEEKVKADRSRNRRWSDKINHQKCRLQELYVLLYSDPGKVYDQLFG